MHTPPVQQLVTRDEGLANRLKRARGDMLSKELAERAHWPQSKVSKIEGGRQLPTRDDLALWAAITDTAPAVLDIWYGMLTEAEQVRRDWARRVRDSGYAGIQNDFNRLIDECTTFEFFETTYIPRFFQTPSYTKAVLTESRQRHGGDDDIEQAVMLRQASVNHLYDPQRTFRLAVTEPVLRWRPRALSPAAHRQQLDRLLTVGSLANVEFAILPLDRQITWWPQNSFELYGDTGFVETWFSEQRLLADEVDRYRRLLEELWPSMLTGDPARQLIQQIMAGIPH